jgi:hypothetical protein
LTKAFISLCQTFVQLSATPVWNYGMCISTPERINAIFDDPDVKEEQILMAVEEMPW